MRTTLSLDTDVYEAAKRISRTSGKRLGAVLSDLARCGLNQSRARFPVFSLPANAPIILASRVQRVIDQEGLF